MGIIQSHDTYRKFIWAIPGWFSGTTTTCVTNQADIVPVEIPFPCKVDRIITHNTGTSTGNCRAGIYEDNSDTPVGGDLLVESSAVAKSSTWRMQLITITETELDAGLYWLAYASDEATSTFANVQGYMVQSSGMLAHYYDIGSWTTFTDPCPSTSTSTSYHRGLGVRVSEIGH